MATQTIRVRSNTNFYNGVVSPTFDGSRSGSSVWYLGDDGFAWIARDLLRIPDQNVTFRSVTIFEAGELRLSTGGRSEDTLSREWEREGWVRIEADGRSCIMTTVGMNVRYSGYFLSTDLMHNGRLVGTHTVADLRRYLSRNRDDATPAYITISDEAYPTERPDPRPAPIPDIASPPPPKQPDPNVPLPVPEPTNPKSGFTIEVQFIPDQWTDISDELYGKLGTRIQRTVALHKNLQSITNSCTVQLFGSERIGNIFDFLPNDLPCRIFKDNIPWFDGFIRGDFGAQFKGGGVCKFEILDASMRFMDQIDRYLGREQDGTQWVNLPLSTTASHIGLLNRIFIASGVDQRRLNMPDIGQVIPRFAVSADEDRKWLDIITPFLFEYGYALNIEADGQYRFYDLFPREVTPVRKLYPGDLEYTKSINRYIKRIAYNSTRVIWYPQETKEDMTLFNLTSGARAGFSCYVKISPGRFYPTEASLQNPVFSVYQKVDGYEVVAAYNQKFSWSQPASTPPDEQGTLSPITLIKEEHHPLFSDIRLQAADSGDFALLTQYTVKGDAVVRDNLKDFREVTLGVPNSSNIREIKTKWILTHEDARRLSDGHTNWLTHGQEMIDFEGEGFNINEIYHIVDRKFTHTEGLFRIIIVTEDDIGRQRITAERIPMGDKVE